MFKQLLIIPKCKKKVIERDRGFGKGAFIYYLFRCKNRGRHDRAREANVPFGGRAVPAIRRWRRQERVALGHGERN